MTPDDPLDLAHAERLLDDRDVRGSQNPPWVGKVVVPELPAWAYEGQPIPRCNTGPNLTQQRLDRYEARKAERDNRR